MTVLFITPKIPKSVLPTLQDCWLTEICAIIWKHVFVKSCFIITNVSYLSTAILLMVVLVILLKQQKEKNFPKTQRAQDVLRTSLHGSILVRTSYNQLLTIKLCQILTCLWHGVKMIDCCLNLVGPWSVCLITSSWLQKTSKHWCVNDVGKSYLSDFLHWSYSH